MRQFYFLLTFFLFFFSENSQAQLVKGTKSLGGYASFSASKYKALQQPNSNYSNQSLSLGISPSYAYFKNNFLLGASISNTLSNFKANSENATSNIDYKSTDYYFNINPFIRYYLKNKNKVAYFGFVDVAYFGTFSKRKSQTGNLLSTSSFDDGFTWRAGFGAHKVLTKNFVAEGILYYEKNRSIAFSVGLRHFYQSLDAKKQDTSPLYITKNRWQVDASFYANNNFKDKTNYIGLNVFGGKMLDNHFMIGSEVSLGMSGFSHSLYTYFFLKPFVRYYIPISNRFFAYPYIGATAYFATKNQVSLTFNRGIGFQYFMTRNLALTCTTNGNFSHAKSDQTSRTSANGALNFGFSYFVK